MSDDDRERIDVNRNSEIVYWAERFGITRAQLIAAVAAAGPVAEDVERFLHRSRTERPRDPRREASRRLGFHSTD
jgi:hypothetical protein